MKTNKLNRDDMRAYAELMRGLPLNDPPEEGSFEAEVAASLKRYDDAIDGDLLSEVKVRKLKD